MGCWPLVLKILLLAWLVSFAGAAAAAKSARARRDDNGRDDTGGTDGGDGAASTPGNVLLVGYQPASSAPQPEPGAALAESGQQPPVNYAELCYLSNGGSSLTLTINEATQVGSIVGSVEVNGNPAPDAAGNVDLVDVLPPVSVGIVVTAAPQRAPNGSLALALSLADPLAAGPPDWSSRSASGHQTRRRLLARRAAAAAAADLDTDQDTYTDSPPGPAAGSAGALDATGSAMGPPVRLMPGTKNLVLVRQLDRELLDAEQSPVLQVSCTPRARATAAASANSEAATTIPVRLLVTDANDHAPEFLGLPYVVNVSETSPVGQVVSRNILATDRDSAGPFSTIHYRVLDDGQPQSQLLQFANPLEPVLVVAAPLDYESLASFTITLVAQDQGEPEPLSSSVQVQVNVLDFDDQNPRFSDDKYTLIMDESQQSLVGQNLQVLPRNLHAEDGDRGINAPIVYSFELAGSSYQQPAASQRLGKSGSQWQSPATQRVPLDELKVDHYLHLNPSTGEVRLIRQWPARWAGAPMTLVVRATQADNRDRYTLTTLTISRSAAGQAAAAAGGARAAASAGLDEPVGAGSERPADQDQEPATSEAASSGRPRQAVQFQSDWLNVSVPESVPINEKVARVRAHLYLAGGEQAPPTELVTGAPPDHKPINYQILDDQHDQWTINGLGEILVRRPLDYEQRRQYSFRVLATYTKYSDICQVQVNVLNVNDNKPKAHDADLNDSIQYSLVGGEHAHLFDISPATGQISLKASTRSLEVSPCQLIVQATDTLGGPKAAHRYSHQARVHIQVGAHLLGPHVDLAQVAAGDTPVDLIHHDARLFNSRSLLQQRPEFRPGPHPATHRQHKELNQEPPQPPAVVNQVANHATQPRSSVATVMSSMQHMLRGAGFLDMPWASALLLSALLAFMICLLLILIITMTVHLYRRHSKSGRQRQQLAAASNHRLNQVHLGSGAALGSPHARPHSGSLSSSSSHFLSDSPGGSGGGPGGNGAASLGARLSISGTPQLHLSPSANTMQHHQSMAHDYMGSLSGQQQQQQQQQPNRRSGAGVPPPPKDVVRATTGALINCTATAHHQPLKLSIEPPQNPLAQHISSLSSQSKRSYRSNSTDDSSVIHCGHYSVNSPHPQPLNAASSASVSFRLDLSDSEHQQHQHQKQRKQSYQAAAGPLSMGELAGCRAYRKLPHLGSLVRPARARVGPAPESSAKQRCQLSAAEESATQTDSAIVSDGSSSGGAGVAGGGQSGALRAHLVAPGRPLAHLPDLFPAADSRIKWPQEAAPPQRVKRLTWDDQTVSQHDKEGDEEEEGADEDCFIAPDIQLEGPISPLSNHQYPIQGTADARGHQYAEEHFLFSTPCSPAASNMSADRARLTPVQKQAGGVLDNARDNCLDYTFVQSSQQFRMETGAAGGCQKQQQQSLSAQHHLLQQQLLHHHKSVIPNYLYSTATNRNNHSNPSDSAAANQALVRNQDLRLLTTAAI